MSTYSEIKKQAASIVTTTNDIEELRLVCKLLLNMIEDLLDSNKKLTERVQQLEDEVNRLKGEHGRPGFRSSLKFVADISSERERNSSNSGNLNKQSKRKKHKIIITHSEECTVAKDLLPYDAIFKGYQTVIVQDLIISPNNIEFKKEVYYSPSLGKNIMAELPVGYSGEFGPSIKALILSLHNDSKMPIPSITSFLVTHGAHISEATVTRIILNGQTEFGVEKADIIASGLQVSDYQHIDDTGGKVNGVNHYVHILCNQFFTAYFTRPNKSRLTVLEILNGGELSYRFNAGSYTLMRNMDLPAKAIADVKAKIEEIGKCHFSQSELSVLLDNIYPNGIRAGNRRIITEASAIAAYRDQEQAIKVLLCDDAPQFKQITEELALCWVHEGRHYKKLTPVFTNHRLELDKFLTGFWDFYKDLHQYKQKPDPHKARSLELKFDALFDTSQVNYGKLAERIDKTCGNKAQLLAVLRYPDIPLHNNPAELGARAQTRRRDISLQTRTTLGTEAKDTMMTIIETAKKLKVNAFEYIRDKINKSPHRKPLAELIMSKAQFGLV